MVVISSVNLDSSTSIPDQVYKVADPALLIVVPKYLQTPSIASTKYTYTLTNPTPSFVTLVGLGDQTSQLKIATTDYSMTNTYVVTIQV